MLVSPHPQPQIDWVREWGRAVRRPTIAPLPKVVVNSVMGEMGRELLLQSQRVRPKF